MTTKELIHAEVERLNEDQLDEVYALIKQFVDEKQESNKPGLLQRLKRIQIDGPEDFAANLDLYLNGEKRV